MPTRTKRRGKMRWRGIVRVAGKQVATKWFGAGKEGQRQALLWEESKRQELRTPTTSLTVKVWANSYLDDIQRRCSQKTYEEKASCFRRFAKLGDVDIESITAGDVLAFLQRQRDDRSGYAANKDRKNLSAAWEWARKFMDLRAINPFLIVPRFPEERQERYVPGEDDFWKVFNATTGQDRVMLTVFLYTGARRGEVFRLKWNDVDFQENAIRLTTRKTKDGSYRADFLPMAPPLKSALMEHWQNKSSVEYVFAVDGKPYRCRQHFMTRLCEKAGVKPFGFHAIRHFTACALYRSGQPVSLIQKILRHQNAGTTERYLKSLGFALDEMRQALEAIGPAKVIPWPKKDEAL